MRLTRLPPRRSGVGLLITLTAPWGVFWASWKIWDGVLAREAGTLPLAVKRGRDARPEARGVE